MRALLTTGGFDIRQWASNVPDVIAHLPTEANQKAVNCGCRQIELIYKSQHLA